jgi:hypothetical protein
MKKPFNKSQKIAIFVTATIFIFLFFAHSPWTGYVTQQYSSNPFGSGFSDLDFWDYYTRDPLLPWFAPLKHVLPVFFLTASVSALFYWLFLKPDNSSAASDEA